MVIDWSRENGSQGEPKRAAQYVRMSTEHQRYSTDNQAAEIKRYAERRGYVIVRTFADEGKSGLSIDGRPQLKQLLVDIANGTADFEAVLVYDVSRWGRFQDPDEAAAYELQCKRAGISVHYCAEQFENDGTIGSSIIKTVKRAMAGEYSRELSVKVFAGQANLIRLGYRQGGAPGFGLRRLLVDQSGEPKATLERGELKSITTDRVILVPGPEDEVAIVREIYKLFVDEGRTEREIAQLLNTRGVLSDLQRRWTRGTIHQILINEKYIGNNVWARTSCKLKGALVKNSPEDWVRLDDAFGGLVDKPIFDRAAEIIRARSERLSDDRMLELLGGVLKQRGVLSGLIIDEAEGMPSSGAFRTRFGSLLRAYALVGFAPSQDYRYLEINRRLRALHPEMVAGVMHDIRAIGSEVAQDETTDLLTINGEFTASIVVSRCMQTSSGMLRWKLRLDNALSPDITIAARMDVYNVSARDYYLLPRLDMHEAVVRLAEHNGLSFDAYRVESLDSFIQLAARAPIRRAA